MSNPVRLSPEIMNALIQVLNTYVKDEHAELRLYGSRTDLHRKGGDIDLLIVVDKPELALVLNETKHYILAKIKSLVGDQKIDLLITNKEKLEHELFLKMILPSSVLLHVF